MSGLDTDWAHIMNTSLEWAVAWSLVGEWTTRTIFLPPKELGPGKAILRPLSLLMTNDRFLCSRGHEHGLNRDPSLLCLPSQGTPLSLCSGLEETLFFRLTSPDGWSTSNSGRSRKKDFRFLPFFCSLLLECDLLAKKVPGRAPYSQHNMIRNWTQMN